MNTDNVQQKIKQLEELDAQLALVNINRKAAIEKVLPSELKAELEAIEVEFGQQEQAVQNTISEIESQVKIGVLALGETVKGERFKAIWNSPRVTWDSKRLDGYAEAHPEIKTFRKIGQPSVSIRRS